VRRLTTLVLVVAALLLAACGSSSNKSSSGSGATATELSYFSPSSPFIISLTTAPSSPAVKNAMALVANVPVASLGEQTLLSKLQGIGINYQTDIKPLLGNPATAGFATTPTSSAGAGQDVLIVWVTSSQSKLDAFLNRILHGAQPSTTRDGAKVYSFAGAAVAVSGATLVFATSPAVLTAALDNHAHGTGFSSADYTRLTTGLPSGGLITAVGSLSGLLSTPKAAAARMIPWVGAIRGYAASLSAAGSTINLQYRLDTSGASLTPAQLPLATGTAAPSLASNFPIVVGVSNPAQSVKFAEAVVQQINPSQWAKFERRQAQAKAKTGYDLNDVFSQLTGNLIVGSDTVQVLARAGVSDPSKVSAILAKLATQPQALFKRATKAKPLGGGFYSIQESKTSVTVGVAAGQFVLGIKTTPAALKQFAAMPATPAAGARGSVAFRIALGPLLGIVLKHKSSAALSIVGGLFGELTGSTQASTSELTGSASLPVK
jgi:Protein of unknown function (DUF3352)